ncbi:UDP-N-acetyl-D-galactosamine dehydrogenase [Arcticibacter tournemirensis]|uniref:Nucleotide sugar dehydrogenase n=1 Tax=Arcticibacter tournemirensis TaxID=699437 RepID=A0A5M9HKK6_9SPHI|nr:nucleotide sugar dehydrogenase [Arcticibacter tournemirensis]KAA8486803.1 nucleotide sugar dehydrogenase [Arcticibacter tournemirensis]TQM49347.1 UDP-N-acetyl-D-galactosamine dehydrogenase [Arcticibacter tournemirensis]
MDLKGTNSVVENASIAIIGLGYVGLPLAIEFAKKYDVLGYDINIERVHELSEGRDRTQEAKISELQEVIGLRKNPATGIGLHFSSEKEALRNYNTFIVTVPTPIDQFKAPDLGPLLNASAMLGSALKEGDLVIYESTVYPGCTEEDCVPVLEKASGLTFNKDFFAGYSPERINPGDKINTLTKIKKVTSGSTPAIASRVDDLYRSIIEAGTHKAPSIKVAEASKAIENAQRDVNISFVNELSLIFDRIGIDTNDVIEAAGTKWNFLKYKPGLVGGHCIGVDPYYLAHKAQSLGYHPQVILSGRRVNDAMGQFVADKVVKLMIEKDHKIKGARALIMGITFKENCPDVRNTRVVDIYQELKQFGLDVDIYDPWADAAEVEHEYGLKIFSQLDELVVYNAVIVAVAHNEFLKFDYAKIKRNNGVIFDTKAFLDRNLVDARL